jgi:Fe-S cluster assembly protein SufD
MTTLAILQILNTKQHIQNNTLAVKAGTSLALMFAENAPLELQVSVEQGARLDLLVLHAASRNIQHKITLQKNSVLNLFYITLDGDSVAQDTRVDMLGENAECDIFGFTAASQTQKCNASLIVNHAAPHCRSRQIVKQIAVGNSSVDFGGRVVVAKDAQHTDAQQTCRTLLLSETAHAHAQPQLEIYADDVKCSHGATVGQLDPESLFYLRSRGVGFAEAQQLLLLGFADEVVQKIPEEEFREKISKLIVQKLSKLL